MSIIDILIAVDGAALASQVADGSLKAGTQSAPTNLGSYSKSDVYISMTTQSGNVNNNTQGQSELQVKANSGDSIRWTMETFDSNIDYTAYLYNGSFNPSANISALQYLPMTTSSYLPPGSDPTAAPTLVHNKVYAAQGTVLQPGATIQYTLSFRLINNQNGSTIGYFTWDPFINVSA